MQARIVLNILSIVSGGAFLSGCAILFSYEEAAVTANVAAQATDDYLRGRNLHLAQRYDEATAAYRSALRMAPDHVDARNGLAIAYAEQRDFARAIPIWRDLTRGATMASGPAAAYLFGNLGYAYFLNGSYDEAVVALEKACLLNPLNDRAWQYLGEALQKLGQDERARQMLRQAGALREHDLRADYATTGATTASPALARALARTPQPDREQAFVEVSGMPGGLLELRRVDRAIVPTAPEPSAPVDPAMPVATLEISNGNGRPGIARQLSRQLRDADVQVVRVTNDKGFGVRRTRIEYQSRFRAVAERLVEHLGTGVAVESKHDARTDVRLVIGHDLAPQSTIGKTWILPIAHANTVASP